MARITNPNGNETNPNNLITALTPIYQELINYTQRQQQQEVEDKSTVVTPELEVIASSLPPLEKLCQTFSLSTFERNILLLCLCRVIFPDAPYWFTQAHGNPRADYPTLGLALQLWQDNHWSAITPTSPLRRWQILLIDTKEDITLAPLRVDETILHYLMEEDYHDGQLARFLKPLTTQNSQLPTSHQQIVTNIIKIWSHSSTDKTVPIVQLCSYQISVSEEIAIAVGFNFVIAACYEDNHPLYYLSTSRLPSNPDELSFLLQRWHRQVKLIGGVLLLDCHNLHQADRVREEAISRLVEDIETPLIVCSEKRKNLPRREAIAFDIPPLTHDEQLALWQANLGEATSQLNGTVESLVTNFSLSGAKIKTACLTTTEQQIPLAEQLWNFCRTQARPQLDDLAQRVESQATWEDLILPEKTKSTLQELASQVRQRAKVYQKWGLAKRSSRGLGVSALFAGESGTGKTLAAEVLANEFKLDLYRIDLSRVVSKYIGETEKNLERIFSAAEGGGVVLLFD
ncbi:MAG: ATP-binding protein, partial [Spirulinaceae cyanobacterium]